MTLTSKPPKRRRSGTPPAYDSDSETEVRDVSGFWPAWLVVEGTEDKKPLSSLNPFAVEKGFKAIAGQLHSIKRLRNGSFLVQCNTKKQSDALLKATMFVDRGIKVYPHKQLNTSKGVIRCRELKGTDEAEIKEGLKSQGVIDVHRVMIKKDQDRVETNTLFLTFCTPTLPQSIKVGFLNVKVEMYVPSPLRCFRCQRFGHTRDRCSGEEICGTCSMQVHSGPCSNPAKCVNCEGDHASSSKCCPVWLTEKEIQRVKTAQKLPFFEARKIVTGDTNNKEMTKLFSAVLKTKVKMTSVGTQTPSVVSTSVNTLQVESSSPSRGSNSATSSPSPQISSDQKAKDASGEGVIVAPKISSSPSSGKNSPKRDSPGAKEKSKRPPPRVEVVEMGPKAQTTVSPKKKKTHMSDRRRKGENIYQYLPDDVMDDEEEECEWR